MSTQLRPTPFTRVEAVTFDYWNTMLIDTPRANSDRRANAWQDILRETRWAIDRDAFDIAFQEVATTFNENWSTNVHFGAEDAAELCLNRLGLTIPPRYRQQLAIAIGAMDPHIELAPEIAPTLRQLSRAGLRLGIICDVGLSSSDLLMGCLDRFGLLELFDHVSFSDQVGHFKPSPVIFEHALQGLNITDPTTAVHVGDLRRTDVAGARNYGLATIRYAGVFDDDADLPDADHVITNHSELPALLLDA